MIVRCSINKCGNSTNCQDGWQPFSSGNRITFDFGYEKVGDKCYCRPGLSLVNNPDGSDGCLCANEKGILSASSYYTNLTPTPVASSIITLSV